MSYNFTPKYSKDLSNEGNSFKFGDLPLSRHSSSAQSQNAGLFSAQISSSSLQHSASGPENENAASEDNCNSSVANLAAEALIWGGDRAEAQGISGGERGKLSLAFDPLRQYAAKS